MERIKAIPTRYKGYHFRSRLEARWAVFFDAMGLRWEYEPEGFELGCGERYLPDFLIEGYCYAEIKPASTPLPIGGKIERFCALASKPVLFLCGNPEMAIYAMLFPNEEDEEARTGKKVFYEPVTLEPSTSKYHPFYVGAYYFRDGDPKWAEIEKLFLKEVPGFHYSGVCYNQVKKAVHAARSARFEFGQEGAA